MVIKKKSSVTLFHTTCNGVPVENTNKDRSFAEDFMTFPVAT